jgi:hypothetical protein
MQMTRNVLLHWIRSGHAAAVMMWKRLAMAMAIRRQTMLSHYL